MALSAHAVVAIALVCAGFVLLCAFALTHSYLRSRNAKSQESRDYTREMYQRGYMTEVRDRNKQAMMIENGYGSYIPPKRPDMSARTETDDSMGMP